MIGVKIDLTLVKYAVMVMGATGLALGVLLGIASKVFHVEADPRVEKITELLPGANCGACGFPGCEGAAEAIVKGEAPVTVCVAGGHEIVEHIAEVLGIEILEKAVPLKAFVHCGGGKGKVALRYIYDGEADCQMAMQIGGGCLLCQYGCLGHGTCVKGCPFGAVEMDEDHLPKIDWEKCRGCGICIEACPRKIISLVPETSQVHVACASLDKGKAVKDICEVGCIACKACEKICEFEAIKVENNIAVIDYAKCTNCGKCVEKCPSKCIVQHEVVCVII